MDINNFKVRRAELSDLDRIIDITIAAADDHALIAFIYPHRHQFPADNRYGWTVLLRPMLYEPSSTVLVAETWDENKSVVVAWVEWEWIPGKSGLMPPELCIRDTWTNSFWRQYYDYKTTITRSLWPRRDDDPEHRKIWVATKNTIYEKHWLGRAPILYLSALYTDPQFQGKGAGRLLKDWGLELARSISVPVGLSANHPRSVDIYKHWCFQEIEIVRMQKEGEEERVDVSVLVLPPALN
ncbi:hypothetical protein K402DRAFT_390384 [Aulographum hederae CBS 113979]|uniref:N-acetyltransferase domain-containing protein n=1 Tax=Aulographum hederae CBS 113979 TaxID=1176131 RepID=A0A6G1HAH8_9PEZI|nr:hypothetical protein K402DRAFT_390384 [Aulographum hederae CBS 113979]